MLHNPVLHRYSWKPHRFVPPWLEQLASEAPLSLLRRQAASFRRLRGQLGRQAMRLLVCGSAGHRRATCCVTCDGRLMRICAATHASKVSRQSAAGPQLSLQDPLVPRGRWWQFELQIQRSLHQRTAHGKSQLRPSERGSERAGDRRRRRDSEPLVKNVLCISVVRDSCCVSSLSLGSQASGECGGWPL